MKTTQIAILILTMLVSALPLKAKSPLTQTPPAPIFKAAEAARLADAYISKTFPKFPEIYCEEVSYEYDSEGMMPDKTILWRLRYLLPNNPKREIPGSSFPDWGVCLVYVHKDKSVTHSTNPISNPGNAEQEAKVNP